MNPTPRRAQVDPDGMIRIPASASQNGGKNNASAPQKETKSTQHWQRTDRPGAHTWRKVKSNVEGATRAAAAESANQMAWSLTDVTMFLKRLQSEAPAVLRSLRGFLLQPVWIPRKKGPAKQRSRIRLFGEDVVRFGATFALLFGGLFLALNYQSFSAILAAQVDPLSTAQEASKLSRMMESASPGAALSVARVGDLLSMVPPVGPPDNHLVIPKLNLNVPIVVPPNTSLLNEDWSKLEEDIQHGLQDGVVHYPGTARPGQAGNFFVTGHSSYYPGMPGNFKSVFARLNELQPGDEFWVYYGGDKHRYRIAETKEVKPSDVSVLDQPTSFRHATLMTCSPVGTTLRRLIVSAEEVDLLSGDVLAVGEHSHEQQLPKVKMELLPI